MVKGTIPGIGITLPGTSTLPTVPGKKRQYTTWGVKYITWKMGYSTYLVGRVQYLCGRECSKLLGRGSTVHYLEESVQYLLERVQYLLGRIKYITCRRCYSPARPRTPPCRPRRWCCPCSGSPRSRCWSCDRSTRWVGCYWCMDPTTVTKARTKLICQLKSAEWYLERETRVSLSIVQGSLLGNANQTNAFFFSYKYKGCLAIGYL